MKKNKKLIAIISCMILLIGAVGATIAWLTDKTEPVVNTFTVGNIDIDLYETNGDEQVLAKDYKMIPGTTLDKDPKVTVEAGSEACWLFIEVNESCDVNKPEPNSNDKYKFSDFIDYSVITGEGGWTQLKNGETPVAGVYYRAVSAVPESQTEGVAFNIIQDKNNSPNEVTVKDTVTKEMMDALESALASNPNAAPKLTFKAYAVQNVGFEGKPYAAWLEAQK